VKPRVRNIISKTKQTLNVAYFSNNSDANHRGQFLQPPQIALASFFD